MTAKVSKGTPKTTEWLGIILASGKKHFAGYIALSWLWSLLVVPLSFIIVSFGV